MEECFMMKKALAIVLAAGFVVGSYATDARVVVMGRHAQFFRDEISVFRNPADISLYPNMLYGSYGYVGDNPVGSYEFNNVYPRDPFFGGMMSYRFSEEENGPMFSIGAFANRRDYILDDLMALSPGTQLVNVNGNNVYRNYVLKEPVAKLDLILGYDLGNGLAVGLGLYGAYQYIEESGKGPNKTGVVKGTLGINWNLDQGLDLEASVNGGRIDGICSDSTAPSSERPWVIADREYFWRGDVRFFSAVPSINGSFVPQVSLEFVNMDQENKIDLEGGVGVNMNIDRGFFWAGVQGVYTQVETTAKNSSTKTSIGARFSFGIERNVITDWFLIRVGGQKEVRNVDIGNGRKTMWEENSPSYGVFDGSDGDLVALGFGLNIDNRLRIDFVAAEDLPYTFTNLVSGNKSYLFNRVSATYRF
jgi:hypothetical protein